METHGSASLQAGWFKQADFFMSENSAYKQTFSVSYEYPVVFTRDVFNPENPVLADAVDRLREGRVHRAAVFIDSGLARHCPELIDRIQRYAEAHKDRLGLAMTPQVVPGGERVKTDAGLIQQMIENFAALELCRQSLVGAVGGGAVLDAVGFAASLFHRGLRLIRVPTTVLAQNDVGVGVKNALNYLGGKNTVGTFTPPFAVLNDFHFLKTLSVRHWIGGIAEAFKVAIIRDRKFFKFLCGHAKKLRGRSEEAMEYLIRRCAELHLEHIASSGDPFEYGRARPLDFGHWAAHKLESMSMYRLGHGQAVAVGLALDSCYAMRKGWLSQEEFEAIYKGLADSGFKLWYEWLDKRNEGGALEILQGLKDFRQHLGGELFITFPKGIGRRFEVQEIDRTLVDDCVRQLKNLAFKAE